MGETGIEGSQRKRHCLQRPPEDVGENVIRNFWKGWRKYGVGSPGPSYIETGIEWNRIEARGKGIAWNFGGISEGWEFNGYFSAYISLLLLQAYLSGSDVKPLLSQGLEEISVSVGSEIRRLGKGGTKICISLLLLYPYLWELNGYFSLAAM